jgi:hypothetical protein
MRKCTYKRNIEARSHNLCCRGKTISITYSECVSVALVIQHAKRMSRIILSAAANPALPYFYTLSHKRHNFRGKKSYWTYMCGFIFSTTFVWKNSHSKNNLVRYYHKRTWVFTYSTRYSCQILMKLEFSRQIFEKILKYQISCESVQWELSCYMPTDGLTTWRS